jgi:integrase
VTGVQTCALPICTIIERNGNFRLKVPLGKDPITGKYASYFETFRGGKPEAQKRLRQLLTELDKGTFVKPGKATLSEFLNKWLEEYALPNVAPRTWEVYEMIIRQHLKKYLGNISLAGLRPEHLQKYYSERLTAGLSPMSVRHHHTLLHKALQTALEWGLLSRNVADAVKPPKVQPKEMQIWTADEISRFLETAKQTKYYALFHLDLFTGLRRSELLGLRWKDVEPILAQLSINRSLHHLKDGSYVFRQPKTAKGKRTIALTPASLSVLQDHYDKCKDIALKLGTKFNDDTLIFCHPENGQPIRPNTITRAWSIIAQKTGLKHIRLHDARHSHASLMLKLGVHPKIVQERLGHSSIQITLDTYSHVTPGMQATAAKSFDEAFSKSYNDKRVLHSVD